MAKENDEKTCDCKKNWNNNRGGGDAVYGFGLIGALFYYLGHATSFATVLLGILKSLVWPAFLVYHLLQFLHL